MNLTDTLVLALLQGVTEFFPVSSSGHLVLLQSFLGLRNVPILFDLILHLGTAAAIVIVYADRIGEILRDFALWIVRGRKHRLGEGALAFLGLAGRIDRPCPGAGARAPPRGRLPPLGKGRAHVLSPGHIQMSAQASSRRSRTVR